MRPGRTMLYAMFHRSDSHQELTWNKALLGDPPGSLNLRRPAALRERNWYFAPFTAEEDAEVAMWQLQAAYRIRARLKGVAFHAARARKAREQHGSEMPYWLSLQGSQMTSERPPPDPSSIEGLTPADLPDELPIKWLHPVAGLLIANRGSELVPLPARASEDEAPPTDST